jgi:hypothetical protein
MLLKILIISLLLPSASLQIHTLNCSQQRLLSERSYQVPILIVFVNELIITWVWSLSSYILRLTFIG